MTTSKELNLARKSLVASLGENAKLYFEKMKLWFQMKSTKEEFDCEARNIMTEDQVHLHNEFLLYLFNKSTKEEFDCEARNIMTEDQVHLHNEFLLCLFNKSTKEEFDCEARNIMTEDQVHLHNEFLLCLFNKVRGLAAVTTVRTSKHNNTHVHLDREKMIKEKRLRLKRKYKTDKSNFEPADVYVEVLGQNSSPVGDEPIGANRSSAQELLLPDRTFVLARLMLAAWENNMDGAEENTAHIVIAATQVFLKNILTAVLTRKKGFCTREGSFIHNIGEPVPSSWKRNTTYITSTSVSGYTATDITDPEGQVPAMKQSVEEAEQATAFALACSTQTTVPTPDPISVADLQQALKVHRNLISNHTIYATNMERLHTYATHLTWEDLDARKMLCQSSET